MGSNSAGSPRAAILPSGPVAVGPGTCSRAGQLTIGIQQRGPGLPGTSRCTAPGPAIRSTLPTGACRRPARAPSTTSSSIPVGRGWGSASSWPVEVSTSNSNARASVRNTSRTPEGITVTPETDGSWYCSLVHAGNRRGITPVGVVSRSSAPRNSTGPPTNGTARIATVTAPVQGQCAPEMASAWCLRGSSTPAELPVVDLDVRVPLRSQGGPYAISSSWSGGRARSAA